MAWAFLALTAALSLSDGCRAQSPAASADEDSRARLARRISSLRYRADYGEELVAGIVTDRATGAPVPGALISRNVWRDYAVDGESPSSGISPDLRDRSDARGRFAILGGSCPAYFRPWDTGITCGGAASRVEILVRAPGYVATVASAPFRGGDREGHAFLVELDRPVKLAPRLLDQQGAPLAQKAIGWMILRDRHPYLEGKAHTDEKGQILIDSDFIAHLRGLEIIAWTADQRLSGRHQLGSIEAPSGHEVSLKIKLGPSAARFSVAVPFESPELIALATLFRGYTFGREIPASPREFRLWVIGVGPHPGTPFHIDSDGSAKVQRIEAAAGRNYLSIGLSPAGLHYRSLSGDRLRLDLSPVHDERWLLVAPYGNLLGLEHLSRNWNLPRYANGEKEHSNDELAYRVGKRRRDIFTTGDELQAPPARLRGLPCFTDAATMVDVLAPGLQHDKLKSESSRIPDAVRAEVEVNHDTQEALIPIGWAKAGRRLVLHRDFNPWPSATRQLIAQHGRLSAFDAPRPWPRFVELVATEKEGVFDFRDLPRSHRVTFRVLDSRGQRCPDIFVSLLGAHARYHRFEYPSGQAPWGLAREADTGLPHATMLTNRDGEIRLREVPLGPWSLATAGIDTGVQEHRITVKHDQQVIVLRHH